MDRVTKALHTQIDPNGVKATVTPLYQSSAFEAGSPYFYSRKNNPNIAELENAIAALEEADHCLAVTTGMAALNLALTLVPVGGHLLINRLIYGCSFKLFQRFCQSRNVRLTILDLTTAAGMDDISESADMVLFETPTNPFLKTVDIRAVATACKATNPDCLVVVDNTWATSLFQQPLAEGADISLHSATKFVSGHSDVMGGLLLTSKVELDARLRDERFYSGAILDPHSAWLLRRSLQTLPLRMSEHVKVSRSMCSLLRERQEVQEVFWPDVDGSQLQDYGGILFFRFAPKYAERYEDFSAALEYFKTGTGMAAVISMVAQPYSGSHASMTAEEKAVMNLGPDLVRLCFGLENPEDLKRDLVKAFDSLGAT